MLQDPRNIFLSLAYLLAIGLMFFIFQPYIPFLIMGIIIVMFLHPVNLWIRKKIKNRMVTSLIMTLIAFCVIFVPLVFLGFTLTDQAQNVYEFIATTDTEEFSETISETLGFEVDIDDYLFPFAIDFRSYVSSQVPNILGFASEIFIKIFLMFFVIYYAFKEGDKLLRSLLKSLPFNKSQNKQLISRTREVVFGVLYGQFLIALIQGILGAFGFWLFGLPNIVFWGFIMAVLSFIPVVGPFVVLLPATIYLMATGSVISGLLFLGYATFVVMNADNVLRSKLIGTKSNMHPLIVLLGILGGISLFGIIGFILGPIALALAVLIIEFFNTEVLQQYD